MKQILKRLFSTGTNATSGKEDFAEKIKMLTGFQPVNTSLYYQAFLHRSVTDRRMASNERLELLGDTVLDLVVTEYFFHQFPRKNEGELTKLRIKMVNRKFLHQRGMQLGIDQLLQASNNAHKNSNSIYGDALEALIGALYTDRGIDVCKTFIHQKIIRPGKDLKSVMNKDLDFKSKVLEWAHQNVCDVQFRIDEDQDGYFVARILVQGEEKGCGRGRSKKIAQQKAAEYLWNGLHRDNVEIAERTGS